MGKNTDGTLGPICNTCGGFGFTHTLVNGGGSAGCPHCLGTGVDRQEQTERRFAAVEARLDAIINALSGSAIR